MSKLTLPRRCGRCRSLRRTVSPFTILIPTTTPEQGEYLHRKNCHREAPAPLVTVLLGAVFGIGEH
jgi:hypothetical protein